MDELDLKIAETIRMLALIVNRAGRSRATTTQHRECPVPLALLAQAKHVLAQWSDGEYATNEVRQAVSRLLD